MISTLIALSDARSAKGALIARNSLLEVETTCLPLPIANHLTPSNEPISAP